MGQLLWFIMQDLVRFQTDQFGEFLGNIKECTRDQCLWWKSVGIRCILVQGFNDDFEMLESFEGSLFVGIDTINGFF